MSADLVVRGEWLPQAGGTQVARAATGVYWQPLDPRREGLCTVWVGNAQHSKAVPGRKTDVVEAEGIADLRQDGLLRGSFIAAAAPRAVREVPRSRATVGAERVRQGGRLPKV